MTRTLNFPLEIKALGAREFEGHGSVFGNVDLGGDRVMAGAFGASLSRHTADGTMPAMFWMHQMDQVPGAWTEMSEDDRGLYVKGTLADTQLGNEMRTLMQMKAVRGLSIGYRTIRDDYDKDGNRLLLEVDLPEVSIVSLAMNPLARVESAKARLSRVGEYVPTEREFERRLRDVGCSKNVARFLIARIFDDDTGGMPDAHQRDAGDVDSDEAAEVLKMIEGATDRMWTEIFRR